MFNLPSAAVSRDFFIFFGFVYLLIKRSQEPAAALLK